MLAEVTVRAAASNCDSRVMTIVRRPGSIVGSSDSLHTIHFSTIRILANSRKLRRLNTHAILAAGLAVYLD
jgi:hypothetical protein